jgi:DNA repair exonuclease SbcCD ATPase subunit
MSVGQNMCVGQNMEDNINNKKPFRGAFDEASEELKQVSGEIEQLHDRKNRVEKAVEVLGRKIESDQEASISKIRRKTYLPGLTVVTRLTVAPADPNSGK